MRKWIELDEKLFDKINIRFPVEDKLSIIVGMNGSCKTLTIEALSRYYEKNNENVLYFPTDRILEVTKQQIESAIMYNKLVCENFFNQINLDAALAFIEREVGEYINRGTTQLLNFLTQINLKEDVTVIIDIPEKNIDMYGKINFIDSLLTFENVKRLVIVTHDPDIVSDYNSSIISIEDCLDFGNGFGKGK